MTLETFNEQKAKFHEQEKVVNNAKAELNKAEAILEALKNEREQFIHAQKAKLADIGTISADEYVELKNKDSGLQARIEYYQALIVDLENKCYDSQEKLYSIQKQLRQKRKEVFIQQAEKLFTDVMTENREKWQEIFALFSYSGHFKQDRSLTDKTEEQAILEYLSDKFVDRIPTDGKIAEEWQIYSVQLEGFAPKSPIKMHHDKFKEQPKGLADLINLI